MLEFNIKSSETIGNEEIVACIGYFDGIHCGHRSLINKAVELAKVNGSKSALITFDPDPWVVLKGITDIKHLTSLDQRKEIVSNLGIDIWICVEFSKEFASLEPMEFIENIIRKLNITDLVCGFDFRFGKMGKGDTELLNNCDFFKTHVIEPVMYDGVKISSTLVETLIQSGDISKANALLSRPYTIRSKVIHGRGQGKELGFPTANVDVNSIYVIPKYGVYLGYVVLDGIKYRSIINVGNNPTFEGVDETSIECHIFDFDKSIYDSTIDIEFIEFVREERRFDSKDDLIKAVLLDIEYAKKGFPTV